MTRPDGRIEKGQKLATAISARAWNRAQDAADVVLGATPGISFDRQLPQDRERNTVLVKNDSGADIPWLGVLTIVSPLLDPAGGTLTGTDLASSKAKGFAARPSFAAVPYEAGNTPHSLVICAEPIKAFSTGLAVISGLVACRVNITSELHTHAGFRPGDYTQLLSSGCGPVRLVWKEPGVGTNKWAAGVL